MLLRSALVVSPARNAASAATPHASGGGQSELDSVKAVEHAEMLNGLKAHIEAMKPLRVKWSREDVDVMWDERTTQHDYFDQSRELHGPPPSASFGGCPSGCVRKR